MRTFNVQPGKDSASGRWNRVTMETEQHPHTQQFKLRHKDVIFQSYRDEGGLAGFISIYLFWFLLLFYMCECVQTAGEGVCCIRLFLLFGMFMCICGYMCTCMYVCIYRKLLYYVYF